MGLETLLRGLVIGFSIAAPVGPIGVLCSRRTLADGRVTGILCWVNRVSGLVLLIFGVTALAWR